MHAETEIAEDPDADIAEDIDILSLWHRFAGDPDSPEYFEITEHGEIVLSPSPANRHQAIVRAVTRQIEQQIGGEAYQELSVLTRTAGIRRPDVVWLPRERAWESLTEGPMETVPPLVAEVISPGNRKAEILHKIQAYLDSGVQEVVVVARNGKVTYHRADGAHPESAFAVKLDLPPELFAR